MNEKGEFREDNFQKAMGGLAGGGEDPADVNSGRNKKGKTKKGGNQSQCFTISTYLS